MDWSDLCKDVLGYVPYSKTECLENIVDRFADPEVSTCGILYFPEQRTKIPKLYSYGFHRLEMPQRVVLDSNVLGCIIKKHYCREFEFWKDCIKVLENIENEKTEGKICEGTLFHFDNILANIKLKSNEPKIKNLIKKTIIGIPHLGIKKEPKIETVRKRYEHVIKNYNIKVEDMDDLFLSYVADKEGAHIITYDTFLLANIDGLPKSFTPEELLGYKIPTQRCRYFCEHTKLYNATVSLSK